MGQCLSNRPQKTPAVRSLQPPELGNRKFLLLPPLLPGCRAVRVALGLTEEDENRVGATCSLLPGGRSPALGVLFSCFFLAHACWGPRRDPTCLYEGFG